MWSDQRARPSKTKPEVRAPLGEFVTPAKVFFDRRTFLHRAGLGLLGLACSGEPRGPRAIPALDRPDVFPAPRNHRIRLPSSVRSVPLTPRETAARHNNFYEFLPGRGGDVAPEAEDFQVEPWRLQVDGACRSPQTFTLDDLFQIPHEERLYHFRCVERWAMNVPWTGFPLHRLLEQVEPSDEVRWVTFESAAEPSTMPGLRLASHYPWPYREALRLDEALHDLTLLATGVYGAPLPRQHGAPLRLVVPWKYGYKSAKSLVRIRLVEDPPTTFWSEVSPHEYGLLSNVNPNLPHPRWGQSLSFWLRDDPVWPTAADTFPTALFNGYEEEVGPLYPDEPREPRPPLLPGEIAR